MIPAEPVALWRYADVDVIVVVTCVVLGLMLAHKNTKGKLLSSISETIAADKRSSVLFSLMMTVCVPLYYAFLWFWVAPLTHAPWYFYALLIASAIAEMVFVWVPATDGMSKMIHQIAAGFVGFVMLAAPLILLLAGQLSSWSVVGVLAFATSSLLLLVLLCVRALRAYSLTYEIIYRVLFWVLLSFIAHA